MVADKFPNGLIGPIGPIGPRIPPQLARNNLLLEGCRVLHSAKIPTMGCTKGTAHCRDFLLGAAIDPLSREILAVDLTTIHKILPYDVGCGGNRGYGVKEVEGEPDGKNSILLTHRLRSRHPIA